MAEYTNNHDHVEIEELPEGIRVDGIGDIHPEDGDDIKVPLMDDGKPYPAHIVPEDLERPDNPDCADTSTEDDDDSYEDWGVEADWNDDDEDEEGSSYRDEDEVAESDSRDRFYEFASNSAALFGSLSSVLSNKNLQELSFSVGSGDLGAYFSIKLKRP